MKCVNIYKIVIAGIVAADSYINNRLCWIEKCRKKETLVIKGFHILYFKLKMRKMGLEPTRGNPHKNLNLARLPFRHFRTTFIIVKVKTVLVN